MPKISPQPPSASVGVPSESDAPAPDPEYLRETAWIPAAIEEAQTGNDAQAAPAAENSSIPPELIMQALGPSFEAIFHAVASFRGNHWELKEFERKALVQGWTPILQHLIAKLGNSEQVLLTLAVVPTAAIVAGKVAQDATKRVSLMASTKTPASGASSVSSASVVAAKPPAQSNSSEMLEES